MADSRLPDVVPAGSSSVVTSEASEQIQMRMQEQRQKQIQSGCTSCYTSVSIPIPIPIPTIVKVDSGSNTLVRIWPNEEDGEEGEEGEADNREHYPNSPESVSNSNSNYDLALGFTSCDSGIDSRVASPVDAAKHLVVQSNLCSSFLGVPKIVRCSSLAKVNPNPIPNPHPHPHPHPHPNLYSHPRPLSKLLNQTSFQEDGSFDLDPSAELPDGHDPLQSTDTVSPSKRIERTNVAVDNEEEAVKVVTSPAICIQHNRDADVGSLDDSTSFSLTEAIDRSGMELEVSCSSGSEGSLLFNQFSFSRDRSISRQLSFCSIRSDCAEQLAKEVALQAMGSSAMEPFFDVGPLSRSSSRSTFLSVPSTRFHRQQQQQQQQQQRWLHSDPGVHPLSPSQTNSYLGSLSSLTSRIYMSKSVSSSPRRYLRLEGVEVCGDQVVNNGSLDESNPFIDLQNVYSSNVLSLTQRLAFPELVASDYRLGKTHRDGHIETESNFNFFAKIITLLVLVFAIVLITGVLVKLYHTPR